MAKSKNDVGRLNIFFFLFCFINKGLNDGEMIIFRV